MSFSEANPGSMVAPAGTAVPPADRSKGRRGWRGWLAAALAVGAPAILVAARLPEWDGVSGGTSTDSRAYDYALSGPPGLGLRAALAAVVLVAAATLVWTARRPRELVAAGVVTAAAIACTALVASSFDDAEITARQVRTLEPGLSRSAVQYRLGKPAGTGHYSDPRRELDCLVWKLKGASAGARLGYGFVCFDGDRFELRKVL